MSGSSFFFSFFLRLGYLPLKTDNIANNALPESNCIHTNAEISVFIHDHHSFTFTMTSHGRHGLNHW